MKIKFLGLFLVLTMLSAKTQAQTLLPGLVEIPLTKAYIPMGFDSNDRIQFVVEGSLPDTCYRLGPTEIQYDETTKKVAVQQRAYLYRNQNCMQVLIPFNKTIELGLLKDGNYKITDGKSGEYLGTLPVASAAPNDEGPDDYFYAIVEDAHLGVTEGQRGVVIRGLLPSACWKIKEMKVLVESENVITILPIMEYAARDCAPITIPLLTTVSLPANLKKGRYLIQVRSLNGQSVNKLFDL